ncbi:MAG: mechanosensitive ion channel domain-containing protein [Terriglobia bacterium]
MEHFLINSQTWLWNTGIFLVAIVFGLIGHRVVFLLARGFAQRTSSELDDSLVRHSEKPARLLFPLLLALVVLPFLPIPSHVRSIIGHAIGLGFIASVAWLIIALLDVLDDALAEKYRIDASDNLRARKIQTQMQVLRRITVVVIIIVTVGVMLMTFPAVRQFGTGLFASAGVAGLVVGLAARSTLSNLLAGVQVALTQPIRLDDVVIVEGEWGWVEEIRTTYVVVRIWDLRRLVVPLSYFIEKPFQNWTRVTADLLGTAFVYVDYSVPVNEVREELHRILQSTDLWDHQDWNLQVTNATEHTLELRALMSASDSSKAWDLRCYVREKLIAYLQGKYPQSLPRLRTEVHGVAADVPRLQSIES